MVITVGNYDTKQSEISLCIDIKSKNVIGKGEHYEPRENQTYDRCLLSGKEGTGIAATLTGGSNAGVYPVY